MVLSPPGKVRYGNLEMFCVRATVTILKMGTNKHGNLNGVSSNKF